MLADETRLASLALGGLVLFFRLLLLAYLAFDNAVANGKAHVVDSRCLGQREHIDAFDPIRTVVAKTLPQRCACNHAADGKLNIAVDARSDLVAVFHFQQQ